MKVINELVEGDKLKLIRESDNTYDQNAIKVVTSDDKEIGYIAKGWAAIFAYKLGLGFKFDVHLSKKEIDKKRLKLSLETVTTSDDILSRIPNL